ncbi:MAG: GAF domain-containing protein [Myxococcales bacterium]|nr:GAF domain-containing protein [Myxococcales bacterium]
MAFQPASLELQIREKQPSVPELMPLNAHDWFVTNGATVVGPVSTGLLLRGVSFGRIPEHCMVRQVHWNDWRFLEETREVRSLRRYADLMGNGWHPTAAFHLPSAREDARLRTRADLMAARDPGEVLLLGLHAATTQIGAELGLIHRFREPYVGMVTSYVVGQPLWHQLGDVLRQDDPVVIAACQHRGVIGSRIQGSAQSAIARRLSVFSSGLPLGGVAMLPLFGYGRLLGMLELGRLRRGFRAADKATLEGVGQAISERIDGSHWA